MASFLCNTRECIFLRSGGSQRIPSRVAHVSVRRHCCRTTDVYPPDMFIGIDTNPPSTSTPCFGVVQAACLAAVGVAGILWVKGVIKRDETKNIPEQLPEVLPIDKDSEAYRLALARSRQAVFVQKALALMKGGEPSRALVEVTKALHENCICRSPLNDGHCTREELKDLYRLHIKHTEVPPSFPVLLQLREMLGLNADEADKIEAEVLQAGASFSI